MKRAIGIGVSLLLIAVIWARVEPRAMLAAIGSVDAGWFTAAVLMVVPLTLITALRFQALARGSIGAGEATRLILSASSLNLVLPSKMGDLAKAIVLRSRHGMGGGRAVALVVFEKLLDLMALLLVGTLALLLARPPLPGLPLILAAGAAGGLALFLFLLPASPLAALAQRIAPRLPAGVRSRLESTLAGWADLTAWIWAQRGLALAILTGSLLLWALHLLQMWLFARAISDAVPMLPAMALAYLAILAGLLPFTFAGIGTRDAALVILFAPFLTPAEGAVLGVFATLRYVLPALGGLPFVSDYWQGRKAPGS